MVIHDTVVSWILLYCSITQAYNDELTMSDNALMGFLFRLAQLPSLFAATRPAVVGWQFAADIRTVQPGV